MKTSIRTEQGGVAKGGSATDVYTKNSGTDYDASFLPGGGGGGSGGGGTKLIQNMTPVISAGSSDIYTETIPGGTLGINNSIRVTPLGISLNSGGGAAGTINIRYGGTIVGTVTVGTGSSSFSNVALGVLCTISANNATNSQRGTMMYDFDMNGGTNPFTANSDHGGSSVDSTINQPLVVEFLGGGGCNVNASGILIELISGTGIGGGGVTINATTGNTLTGATLPQPMSFGDGSAPNFFVTTGSGGGPTFQSNVGTAARQQVCLTFVVDANQVVLMDSLGTWVDSVVGSPVDNLRLSIQTTTAGEPDGTILAFATMTPPNSPAYYAAALNVPLELTAGDYAFVIDRTGALDGVNYWTLGAENIGGTNLAPYFYDGAVWQTSDIQPRIRIAYTYAEDSVFISAQASGGGARRMHSVLVNSGGGNPTPDTIPAVLQTSHGFASVDASIGDTVSVAISGAVPGFSSLPLNPVTQYHVTDSLGSIATGASGTLVGRSLTTDTMLIIPA